MATKCYFCESTVKKKEVVNIKDELGVISTCPKCAATWLKMHTTAKIV